MTMIPRSPNRSPSSRSPQGKLYSFAVIVEPTIPGKERHSLKAYFNQYPFPFEIDEWAKNMTGSHYRVIDSFRLEEIEL